MVRNVLSVLKGENAKVAINFGGAVRDLIPRTAAGKIEKALELTGEANGFRIKMLVESIKLDCDRAELDMTILVKKL